MCSVIILFRPDQDWPLILASNRDEMLDRPWIPPSRHWSDRPQVVAGRDLLAGGTWLGVNDQGVVAGILNRVGSLGPESGKRSRGELVLDALDFADSSDAVEMMADLDGRAYRPFNMVIADNRDAYWLRCLGTKVEVESLPHGLSMITAHDRNDPQSPRIRHYLPKWREAQAPRPGEGEWSDWKNLILARDQAPGGSTYDCMFIVSNTGFGTVSSSLIALPSVRLGEMSPVWLFASGRAQPTEWRDIDLTPPA